MKKFLQSSFFYIVFLYLLTRLANILLLPIFNDEAIYIDWGAREINLPGFLFYSLYDAKPPLLMWIFAIFGKFIGNPLLAGRIVSVIAGLTIIFGIQKIASDFFSKKIADYASIFYVVIPLFVFFDRQALMESSVAAIGVWSMYFFIKFITEKTKRNAICLGVILGLGIYIKQTVLVFVISETILFVWWAIKNKTTSKNWEFVISVITSQIVLLPLYFQGKFWETLSSNSRFTLSPFEILSLPISTWFNNFVAISSMVFWYIGPLALGLIFIAAKNLHEKNQKIILFALVSNIVIIGLSFRALSPRYLVSFLPLSTIIAAHGLVGLKLGRYEFATFIIGVFMPAFFAILLIASPLKYFDFLKNVTSHSQYNEYVDSWTNGYATRDAISFIGRVSARGPIAVGTRVDTGNPESAVFAYFHFSKRVRVTYFDANLIDPGIFDYDCLTMSVPFYFVARNGNLAGMDKFLEKLKTFENPTRTNSVDIYGIKQNCKGKTINLEF